MFYSCQRKNGDNYKKIKKEGEEDIWRKMLFQPHFHTTANVAVNFQYLQSQA